MTKQNKKFEVYEFVKLHSNDYYNVIIQALNDGIKEQNQQLRNEKSNVEAGIVSLFQSISKGKIKKMSPNQKDVLKTALTSCTFFNFKQTIESLDDKTE